MQSCIRAGEAVPLLAPLTQLNGINGLSYLEEWKSLPVIIKLFIFSVFYLGKKLHTIHSLAPWQMSQIDGRLRSYEIYFLWFGNDAL